MVEVSVKGEKSCFLERLGTWEEKRKASGLEREWHVVQRGSGREVVIDGKRYLNLGSNDYLGLARNAEHISRSQRYILEGTGSGSSRLILGNHELYEEVERILVAWKEMEGALVLSSGYAANVGLMPALVDRGEGRRETVFLFDRMVHASMIDGVRLSGARWASFRHNDMKSLTRLVQRHYAAHRHIIILTEAVFSMEGDCAPLAEMLSLSEVYGTFLVIDEAHALGVYGEEGEGFSRDFKFKEYPQVLSVGTFGKSVGVSGAYIASGELVQRHLRQTLRSLIYSTGLPPVVLGSIIEGIGLIREHGDWCRALREKANGLKERLSGAGLVSGASQSAIIPVIVGSNEKALGLADLMRREGLWAPAIRAPTVRLGEARIRLSLSHVLSAADLEKTADVIIRGCATLGISK